MPYLAFVVRRSKLVLTLLGGALAIGAAQPASASLYSESFPNGGSNAAFSTVGWNAHIGASATADTGSSDSVVSNATGKTGVIGYGAKTGLTTGAGLYWTTEIGTVAPTSITSIQFFSNNASTADILRVAIRIDNGTPGNSADDTWYATNTAFQRNSSTAGSSTNWVANGELETFAFTSAAASWRDLTFVPGSSLSIATSARLSDLPAGNINAVGIFGSGSANGNIAGVIRFDEFTVVPEPSGVGAALLAATGLLIRRRRARSR